MAAIVHYPAAKANGAALTTQRFPAVVFIQGANVDAGRYAWLGELAQYGYIVVLPDKYPVAAARLNGETGINTNTKLPTVDLLDHAVKRLHAWAATPQSAVAGRFDGRVVLAGHSLGGVVAITALDPAACLTPGGAIAACPPLYVTHPSIVALWLIGGHFENPYGPADVTPIGKPAGLPVYLVAGANDGLSTPAEVQATWRRYAPPKRYYELPGANHFNWTAYLHPEDDLRSEVAADVTPVAQQAATVQAVRRFMDCELVIDVTACSSIPTTPVLP
jgi:alpha-beta hydrolase superfamily lysophospholipase